MDLQLRGMSGLKAIHAIRAHDKNARIIVVTVSSGDEDIFRAIQAGAASYLLKDALTTDLVDIVREVHQGGRPIPPEVASRLAARVGSASLSAREIEILELVAKGMRNKEIAGQLGVSQETVQTHIKRPLREARRERSHCRGHSGSHARHRPSSVRGGVAVSAQLSAGLSCCHKPSRPSGVIFLAGLADLAPKVG